MTFMSWVAFCIKKSVLKEDAYKLNEDKWWFFSTAELCAFCKDSVKEKVSGHRKLCYFNL